MRAVSLFSGIGGLDLAAEKYGIETVAFCEIDEFAVKVLQKRFPGVPVIPDVKKFTNKTLKELGGSPYAELFNPADFGEIDVVHGGFPCQDLSVAGKRKGLTGERSGLWFEMLRVVEEFRPRFIVAENVRGAVNIALDTVVMGLEAAGYSVRSFVVPAAAFGAPHKRERLFVFGIRRDVEKEIYEIFDSFDSDDSFLSFFTGNADEDSDSDSLSNVEKNEFGESSECEDSTCFNEEDCGKLWPTPSVYGNHNRKGASKNSGDGLSTAVKMWPTPQARDYRGSDVPGSKRFLRKMEQGRTIDLNDAVFLWLTPSVEDGGRHGSEVWSDKWADGESVPSCHKRLRTQILTAEKMETEKSGRKKNTTSLSLNPEWVECLMGFPGGWTDLHCSELVYWEGWPALMGEKMWVTPRASEGKHGGPNARDKSGTPHLSSQVHEIVNQYFYEPPRLCGKTPNRPARIKALGNAVVPVQVEVFFQLIEKLNAILKTVVSNDEKIG